MDHQGIPQDNLFSFSPALFLSGEFLTLLESHFLNAFPPRHTIFSLQAEIMTSFFDVI